jgi:hypothetical protein
VRIANSNLANRTSLVLVSLLRADTLPATAEVAITTDQLRAASDGSKALAEGAPSEDTSLQAATMAHTAGDGRPNPRHQAERASLRGTRSLSPIAQRRAKPKSTAKDDLTADYETPISFWRTTSHGDLNADMALEHDAAVHPAPLGGEAQISSSSRSLEDGAPPCRDTHPVDFHEHGLLRDELTGALHATKQ